ncbi:response regulator transcription factor [Nocardioides stalactiti]|uniref:response regulator transcription factor n=1 Tax=Nocardioides stalactiti TaxID=2755356 RepID=UPI001600E56D|nr:response regulator transcription factor [Nocardioides stalactiti]
MARSTSIRPGSTSATLSTTSDARVLVVEDERAIRELLARTLQLSGFVVQATGTYRNAISAAESFRPDLAVLDVLLPDGSGLDLCQALRAYDEDIAVVFVTARDAVPDRLTGFALGADDYLVKPFSVAELVARVNAVLRRRGGRDASDALVVAGLVMRDDSHEVSLGGRVLDLSPTEYRLLRYLMVNQGRVLSKEQILSQVWRHDYFGDAGVVEKFVSQVRRKLDDGTPALIQTVRGFGYVLRDPR